MKRGIAILLFCGLLAVEAAAQEKAKYWVFFTHKDTATATPAVSPRTLSQRQRLGLPVFQASDLPVPERFVAALRKRGVSPVCRSRWLNACSAELDTEARNALSRLPFVCGFRRIRQEAVVLRGPSEEANPNYDRTIEQMGASVFRDAQLDGTGVTIGVIDAGFYGAQKSRELKHLFSEERILGVRDFVNPQNKDPFNERETASDRHGTQVLGYIAGLWEGSERQRGLATGARFYLARTDHGKKEFRGEEDYWVAAVEWMDSLGVRLINTSLGYSIGFDEPEENYSVAEMDGKTAITTRAATIAVQEKGMILVSSAGNEGNDSDWGIVSAPADAEAVLAVAATNTDGLRMGYSSLGPETLPYLKPNVACYSLFGTSFAAPAVTGFAACLLQRQPDLSPEEIYRIVEQSAHLYPFGNNHIGYGIPSAERALVLLAGDTLSPRLKAVPSPAVAFIYTVNPRNEHTEAVAFHKKDSRIVLKTERLNVKDGRVRVARHRKAEKTTLVVGDEGVEIIWP